MSEHQNFNTAPGNDEALGIIETRNLHDPIPPNSLLAASKHDQSMLVKTIGERLRAARELNNLSQSEAALRLGYANPSKLSRLEAASDGNSVPIWVIQAAAKLYEVPIDFLFGVTEEFETGVPRGTQAYMLDAWDRMRQRDLLALDLVHREVLAVAGGTDAVLSAVSELSLAISAWCARTPDWEDLPGLSTVMHRLGKLEAAATDAKVGMQKLRITPKRAA